MGSSIKLSKDYVWIFSIVLLSSILILVFSNQKINYHIDELLTYSLSNSTSYIDFTPGEKYESYGEHQEKYLTASNEISFDYRNVWVNQANDVHPPFYYVIVHTISSFMPGVFSKYIGIAVNILFNALIILLLYKFSLLLTNNKSLAYLTSLFWAFNPGVISDMMFIRMYIMTMFFCLLISYVHIKYMSDASTKSSTFYLTIFFVSLAGALTHYYFLVYTFFVCALFGLFLLYKKRWKELLSYVGTYIITIGSVVAIFPSIFYHMLGGERGIESIENFTNTNGYLQTVKAFWEMISNQLFGGFLLVLVIVIMIAFILVKFPIKLKNDLEFASIWKSLFLLIACTLFLLLVSNIAVYTVERYLQPIFPIVILIFVTFMFLASKLFLSNKVSILIVAAVLVLISGNGYGKTASFEYLKHDSAVALETAEQYSDHDVIFIYDRTWKIPTNYKELAKYQSVTFYGVDDLDSLYENTDYDQFVIYSHADDEAMIQTIVDQLPNVDSYKKLNSYGYCDVYFVE